MLDGNTAVALSEAGIATHAVLGGSAPVDPADSVWLGEVAHGTNLFGQALADGEAAAGVAESPEGGLQPLRRATIPSGGFGDLSELLRRFLGDDPPPSVAALGVPGPVGASPGAVPPVMEMRRVLMERLSGVAVGGWVA